MFPSLNAFILVTVATLTVRSFEQMESWRILTSGRECFRFPTNATNQRFQRLAHRNVIVDDEHGWGGVRYE
jgi:hypothetical protein